MVILDLGKVPNSLGHYIQGLRLVGGCVSVSTHLAEAP